MSAYCEPKAVYTDWETPQWLFDYLNAEFNFTLDVCATYENKKCLRYYRDNSLDLPWEGICWMNPPYGKEIGHWIEKAYKSTLLGATVVCLLPVRSNCDWWKWIIQGEVRFIRRKLQFVGAPQQSMFPNVIVIFRPGLEGGGKMSILDVRR